MPDDQQPTPAGSGDPDAIWRPGGNTLVENGQGEAETNDTEPDDARPDDTGPDITGTEELGPDITETGSAESRVSPWSRQAAEQPRPTEEALRAKWRRELGLSDHDDGDDDPAPDLLSAPAPIAFVADAPTSSATGEVLLGAILVALMLIGAAISIVQLLPDGVAGPDFEVTAVRLPPTAEPQWSVDLDAPRFDVVADDMMLVASSDSEITAYDIATGTELWQLPVSDDVVQVEVALFGDVVVVIERSTAVQSTARGLWSDVGEQVWATVGDNSDFGVVRGADGEPIGLLGVERTAPLRWQVIDVATGFATRPQHTLGPIVVPTGFVAETIGNRVQLIDVATDTAVGPSVGALGLVSLVPLREGLVGFGPDGDIIAFDATGEATDQRPFVSEAFGDFPGRATLVGPVPGTDVVIVSSGSSIAVEVVDGLIEVRWEVQGRVGEPVVTDRGPLSVARLIEADTGKVNLVIADPLTGEIVAPTDVGLTREEDPVIGGVGFVVAPPIGAGERQVEAIAFDGTPLWKVPLPNLSKFQLADGRVIVIDQSARPSISVYG